MFRKAMEAGNRTTGGGREAQPWRRGRAWVLGTPVASMAEASGSSSGTCLAAPPSFKSSLGADLAFHLNLASTRDSWDRVLAVGTQPCHWLQLWVNPGQAGSTATPRGCQKLLGQRDGRLPGDQKWDAVALLLLLCV